ncbi:MAG TPA: endonuclease domain-containing protein [Patescibacteria group bacterium]|nr:endonuclease domain-containing protein [Patescibacteria group bacterium]
MKRYFLFNNPGQKIKRRIQIAQSTSAELILWQRLKTKQLGLLFSRQYSIGPYFIDFYCPSKRLAIEIDGKIHQKNEAVEYDKNRTAYLSGFNIKTMRFQNEEILNNIEVVITEIINFSHSLP